MEWVEVAENLNEAFSQDGSQDVSLKGRGCKERLHLLVKKYKDDDKKALKRSGTEEEYSELHKLFEDLVTYQRDSDMKKAEEKEAEESKKLNEKRKGESMRKAAMERLSKKRVSTPLVHGDDESVEEDEVMLIEDEEIASSKEKENFTGYSEKLS